MKKLIGNWLEDVIEAWGDGLSYLFGDDLISFYTFFTVIFAECAYLWAFHEAAIAIPFTIILLGYVLNVIVCAWFKGNWEGTKIEVIFTFVYVIDFVVLFIIGFCVDIWISLIVTGLPLAITALWIEIRHFQDSVFLGKFPKIVIFISKLFRNKIFYLISQLLVVGGPFVAFAICFAQIPTIHVALKIIIPILYLICIPFIAYYQDNSAALGIFELAYEVTWSKKYEEEKKKWLQQEEIK